MICQKCLGNNLPSSSSSSFCSTGVAPAKKSPKLVNTYFVLSVFPLLPSSFRSSLATHTAVRGTTRLTFASLSFSHLVSESSPPGATCADLVGLFVDIGMLSCVWGWIPVALHQCCPPPALLCNGGWDEGLWCTVWAGSLTRWWWCRAGVLSFTEWELNAWSQLTNSLFLWQGVGLNAVDFVQLQHVCKKCFCCFCRPVMSWLLLTAITKGYVMLFQWSDSLGELCWWYWWWICFC